MAPMANSTMTSSALGSHAQPVPRRIRGSKKSSWLRAFYRSENGSYTIESVIWLPIYVFILAIMMNVSMVFFNESQLLRVVQDANRSFAVGRIATLTAVEQYVTERIAYLKVTPTVNTQLVDGIIYTDLSVTATQLMPFTMLHEFFSGTEIVVSAQQIVEF